MSQFSRDTWSAFLNYKHYISFAGAATLKKKRKLKEPLASILRLKKWEFYMTYIYMT